MPLEDYKDVVGNAASICTIGQFFAGVFICKDIIAKGSTKNVSVVPFLGGISIGCLMMIYSQMLNDSAMIRVNVAGMALNVGYLLCYYYYSTARAELHVQMLKAAGFVMLVCGYVRWEDPEKLEFRYGIIMTMIMFLLIGAPLFSLGDIIRTQSTETLPFPLIFSGTIVSSLWLLYGVIIQNTFVQIQNIVGLTLCIIQLSLFVIYPTKAKAKSNKTKKQ